MSVSIQKLRETKIKNISRLQISDYYKETTGKNLLLRINELKDILPQIPSDVQPISSCGCIGCGCGGGDKT